MRDAMRTAVIFPGQGAQVVGMGRDAVETSPAARAVFEEARQVVGYDLADVCFNGPAERLNATEVAQPAIFVTSVALYRAMQEHPGFAAGEWKVDATAGLSLGEYTALWLANAVSFEEGLRLVQARGRLMQRAADETDGGMVSVMGLDEAGVAQVLAEAVGDEVLVAANYNAPGQVVLSGSRGACGRVVEAVARHGGRGVPLKVAGAFHSPLMASAAEGLRRELERTTFSEPSIPVVSNVIADYHGSPSEIRALLAAQLTDAVRWQACVERLVDAGIARFVEVGPGRVLTGLMRSINRAVTAVSLSSAAAIGRFASGGAGGM